MTIASRARRSLASIGLLGMVALGAYAADGGQPSPAAPSGNVAAPSWLVPAATSGLAPGAETAAAAAPIGTRDTVLAGPQVPRASGTPCVVELFRNVHMRGIAWPDGGIVFPYAPPAGCPGPWAKVILKASFHNPDPDTYQDGFMYASIALEGVPLYSGGGQVNDAHTHWRIERDVTDFSAILRTPRDGILEIEATPRFGPDFRSPYYGSATLLFYPVNPANRALRVPDDVHPLTTLGWQDLWRPGDTVARSLSLPRNIERVYLDVMAHPLYSYDVFWFTCVPDDTITAFPELTHPLGVGAGRFGLEGEPPLQGCGGGAFREVQVSIDGQPAGIVPVFPRVYPRLNALWDSTPMFQPSPPPQALNFMPYRVDLTPFAGLLSDGAPHVVELSVAGNGNARYFSLSGTLLVYRDNGTAQVVGQVTRNTLSGQPPAPTVTSTLARNAAGEVSGKIRTRSSRSYAIEGYIDTSRGRVRSTVERTVRFDSLIRPQVYDPAGTDADTYRLAVSLKSTVNGTSRRYLGDTLIAEDREYTRYPLELAYRYLSADLQQGYIQHTERWRPGVTRYYTRLEHETGLTYAADELGNATQWQGYQSYLFRDSYSSCYLAELTMQDGMLASRSTGAACPGGSTACTGPRIRTVRRTGWDGRSAELDSLRFAPGKRQALHRTPPHRTPPLRGHIGRHAAAAVA